MDTRRLKGVGADALSLLIASPSSVMGIACLVFLIIATWRSFNVRHEMYLAKHLQDECGKNEALEMETARFTMHKSFNSRPEIELTSVTVTFSLALTTMFVACIFALRREPKISNVNLWIFLIMATLSIILYNLVSSLLKRKTDVRVVYSDLQALVPMATNTSGLVPALSAFPDPFTEALVRRWYAVNSADGSKSKSTPDTVKQLFESMLKPPDGETAITKAQFDEFMGYVHPASDIRLAGKGATGLTLEEKKAQRFLENLRPLVDAWNYDETASIAKQMHGVEWTAFIAFFVLAFVYIIVPLHSEVAYAQMYGTMQL